MARIPTNRRWLRGQDRRPVQPRRSTQHPQSTARPLRWLLLLLFAVMVAGVALYEPEKTSERRPEPPGASKPNPQPSSRKIVERLFAFGPFGSAMAWSPDSQYVALGTYINDGKKQGKVLVFDT